MAQRITARYHLLPLSREEVAQYIQHRLAIAECQQPLFNRRAINTIHELSNGIPRLINLLCDRALLGAYGENKPVVDKKLVLGASVEALGAELNKRRWWQQRTGKLILATLLLTTTVALGFLVGNQQKQPLTEGGATLSEVDSKALPETKITIGNISEKETVVPIDWSSTIADSRSLPLAVQQLFRLWHLSVNEPLSEPCQVANNYDLSCYWFKGSLSALLKLNYPAVFKFIDANGSAFYGTLLHSSDASAGAGHFRFRFNAQEQSVDKAWLERYWQGGAVIFWQPPKSVQGGVVSIINEQSPLDVIQWLENKVSEYQQRPPREMYSFDAMLKNQLQQYQRQHGIDSSSGVNEQTLMLLTNTVAQGLPIFK